MSSLKSQASDSPWPAKSGFEAKAEKTEDLKALTYVSCLLNEDSISIVYIFSLTNEIIIMRKRTPFI